LRLLVLLLSSLILNGCLHSEPKSNSNIQQQLINSGIEDAQFIDCLLVAHEEHKKIGVAELEKIKLINCKDYNIYSIKGINYFQNLETLILQGNLLVDIDLSSLKELSVLIIEDELSLININFGESSRLEIIEIENTSISSLSIPNNLVPFRFSIRYMEMEEIDFGVSSMVQNLRIYDSSLPILNVGDFQFLEFIFIEDSVVSEVVVNNAQNLIGMAVVNLGLASIELRNLPLLYSASLHDNILDSVVVESTPSLRIASFDNNNLSDEIKIYLDSLSILNLSY